MENRRKESETLPYGVAALAVLQLFLQATPTFRPEISLCTVTRMASHGCFLYFAYGSNLLTERIHINNPSAKMITVGKLRDYRLDFNYFSRRWQGAAATIIEDPGNHLYGVLWEISNEDMANLDKQEGVQQGIYKILEVDVEAPSGELVKARSYQIIRPIEEDRRPSSVYMDVILQGARENGLPEDYIRFLEGIENNGYTGKVDINVKLTRTRS